MYDSNTIITFCATIRNCGKFLPFIFQNIDRVSSEWIIKCIFVYDNCSDNTQELLVDYKNKSNHHVLLYELKENNSSLRTVRISNGRNKCLEILEQENDSDIFIMIDADNVNANPWNINIINYYLKENTDWDMMSFNKDPYYDIWALSIDDYSHHVWGFGKSSPQLVQYMKRYMKVKLSICEEDSVSCKSAFNGFALYKSNRFKHIRYDGTFSKFIKENLVTEEERQSCLEKYRKFLKDPTIIIKQCELPFLSSEEHCEHLYFHQKAIKENHCKIKISKFSIG